LFFVVLSGDALGRVPSDIIISSRKVNEKRAELRTSPFSFGYCLTEKLRRKNLGDR
jgi:hypothetical protein